jgi:hypothetical protein
VTDMRSMRMLAISPSQRVDRFVRRQERVSLDVPGGRVTFHWENSGSDLGYAHLRYEPIRAGLVRFGQGPGGAM